jgi:alanine-glyoxylate transaminase/serine-glyoxylate transaminase/serine-pyruvate transaminase
MRRQTLTHLNHHFLEELREIQELLRKVFTTDNQHTGFLTGSGTLGNEAAVQNFVHPGDRVIVCDMGWFSHRILEMLKRRDPSRNIEVDLLQPPNGRDVVQPDQIEEKLKQGKDHAGIFIPKVETSTGAEVPFGTMSEIWRLSKQYNVPLLVDGVCALGGTAMSGATFVSSCSQKGLSAPAGVAPFTLTDEGMERIQENKKQGKMPGSVYTDLEQVMQYFSNGVYHNTPPIHAVFGLRVALQRLLDRCREQNFDLDYVFGEHRRNQEALNEGLETIGFKNPVHPDERSSVTSVFEVPDDTNAHELRKKLMQVKSVLGGMWHRSGQSVQRGEGKKVWRYLFGRKIGGVEVAAGKRDPAKEIRVAQLGEWSRQETTFAVLDAFGQVTGAGRKAVDAAEDFYKRYSVEDFA